MEHELKAQGLGGASCIETQIVPWSREQATMGVIKLLVKFAVFLIIIVTTLNDNMSIGLWNEAWMLLCVVFICVSKLQTLFPCRKINCHKQELVRTL